MRLVVLSDVHGNLPALEAVLDDARRRRPDGYVVAGDLTGGPHANAALDLLRGLPWVIRGNTDDEVLLFEAQDLSETLLTHPKFALFRWAQRNLSRENAAYLQALPGQLRVEPEGVDPLRVVHGSPRDPSEAIFPMLHSDVLNQALARVSEPVLVCGHTHLPWQLEQDGRLIFNPGAVSGPFNGDTRAQYALLTWRGKRWEVEHHAAAYDHTSLRAAFRDSGLLEEGGGLARGLLLSIETGQFVNGRLAAHAARLAAEAGGKGGDPVPAHIWEQAVASFNWSEFEK